MVRENKKKHRKILHNSNVGEDMISNLPDELIHHILSLVPIKRAMSTCILSKRWRFLVYSTPILDLRNWRECPIGTRKNLRLETRCFMNFLDAVICLHDKPNIQKFYLDVDEFFDESRVYKWIKSIMKHKIEEFGLSLEYLSTSSVFPLSLFTCESLTLLDLDFKEVTGVKWDIPNTISFPKLKILRLASLDFVDETSTQKFTSNCPILEELSLSDCWIPNGSCIGNHTLKHLCMTTCGFEPLVKISAPSLLTFSFLSSDPMPRDIVLSSFPSLVEAVVHFVAYYEYEDIIFVKLFQNFSSAKLLKLCADLFQVLREADILLNGSVTFDNLIHLEITSQFRYTNFDSESIPTVRTFFRFLRLTPNLESIVFTQSIYNPEDEDDGCWSFDPECSLPHLKTIKFQYFDGKPMELDAIKLFLKCAGFLETATIVASPRLSKNHQHQLYVAKLLLKFPKPANCVVEFLTS